MSKGPGRVSRAIEATLEAESHNAFTVEDLCNRVYLGNNRVEKKHRVAVLRAAKAIVARHPELAWKTGGGLGGPLVLFNRYRVMSYAVARLKADRFHRYRSNDNRDTWSPRGRLAKACYGDSGKGMVWRIKKHDATEAELRARLSEDGPDHEHIVPGGTWWCHVQMHIAERDGDFDRLARLKAEHEQNLAAILHDTRAVVTGN